MMLQKILNQAKGNRRDYISILMKHVVERTPAYAGAQVTRAPGNSLNIKLTKSVTNLQRFQTLNYSNRYLYLKDTNQVYPIDTMSEDASSGLLVQSNSPSGNLCVRFRKGEKNEKDVFVEVWTTNSSNALRSTVKVTEKMAKVYNDAVFGGISWSQDESKICFIGEVPEPAAYKNPWDAKKPEEDKKTSDEESKKEESKKEEDQKEEHFQDEKFLLNRDFGETLVGKKVPAIFIFDLEKNTINQVQGLP